ncbi:hypothetical protein BDV33DRAFT_134269 [Aspergillus novoparasiticus]|uniref:Ketoreductase domain-containing protein n=1 Tax=Aspergillus novoparasiticus TaxID=986946 RepID=A0A5N6ELG5_9EURO|nr:hypothetical protein BDV33DRAFT_134269 [Aspergillus novoparasiticus]
MMLSLADKNAIVTGGSRGIGLAIAQELARRGASVFITYVSSKPRADKAVSEIQSVAKREAKVAAMQANSENAAEAARLVVAEAHRVFGFIDIIVNNAADGSDIDLAAVTTENFDRLFHVNLLFPLLLVRESRQHLRRKARVVNISSTSARRPYPGAITYAASKAALENVTGALAFELGREFEATVNAVNPGPVRTDMWNNTPGYDEIEKAIHTATAAGDRIGNPTDIADIVAFLCEEQSRWISGSTVCANGGYVPT